MAATPRLNEFPVNKLQILANSSIQLCKLRGWPLTWDHRLAYTVLEASEFTEAIREKKGDPVKEAGDVLIAVIAMLEAGGVTISQALKSAEEIIVEMHLKPDYASEVIKESPLA